MIVKKNKSYYLRTFHRANDKQILEYSKSVTYLAFL